MRKSLLVLFFLPLMLMVGLSASATHNRAGEITYRHIDGFTWEVTVLICSDVSDPNNADRPFIPITWGHGTVQDSIARTLEDIVSPGVKRNEYTTEHTFPGPGIYELYVEDPNRNGGILNIPSSIEVIFSVSSILVIPSSDPLGGFNNSPQLLNPPKGDACAGSRWLHNPAAFDPDGDSLAYELVECTAAGGAPIADYVFPNEVSGAAESLTIDPLTGSVVWENPTVTGEYNLCIKITEFRNGFFNGSVIRDMQIIVRACNNDPPDIDPLMDICVLAGSSANQQITASDPELHFVSLTLSGEPFMLGENSAEFIQTSNTDPITGSFQWIPSCDEVRLAPYNIFVTARDSASPSPFFTSLTDVETFSVQVIAPAVTDVTAQAINGQMVVDWNNNFCSNATGYKVYRRVDSQIVPIEECTTGLDDSFGYELIAMVDGWANSDYIDPNVPFGFDVCYRIVSCFADGAESQPSEEDCASIDRVIPVITAVSVGITDTDAGQDTIRWIPPIELDTLTEFTGEFFYRLYRTVGLAGDEVLVETTAPSAILDVPGGFEYIDTGLDTEVNVHTYAVEIFHLLDGEETLVSRSNPASSIFLVTEPLDQGIQLSWVDGQPWDNFLYEVFVLDEVTGEFVFLADTTEPEYLHEGLDNGQEYCYYIRAIGEYDPLTLIPGPFFNFSQERCAVPIDLTPPCPPQMQLSGQCEFGDYELSWTDPNQFCADDVTEYNLYYSPTITDSLEFLTTISGSTNTDFTPIGEWPIGCYAVTALDTRVEPDGSQVMNESELSNRICIEGCPLYTLPNVITPNGDGENDVFRPFEPWRYVESVDFKVYNRWGNIIYNATDPILGWQGTSLQTDAAVSDGVYYYTIDIFEVTLEGVLPRSEAGTIHVIDNTGSAKE